MKNFNKIYQIILNEDISNDLALVSVDLYIKLLNNKFKDWKNIILNFAKELNLDIDKIKDRLKEYSKISSFKDIYKILSGKEE